MNVGIKLGSHILSSPEINPLILLISKSISGQQGLHLIQLHKSCTGKWQIKQSRNIPHCINLSSRNVVIQEKRIKPWKSISQRDG
jgi:hypothetical protein